MFGISWDQISGFVQRTLMFLGGLAVGKGWVSEQLMIQLVGVAMGIIGFLWGIGSNTEKSLVKSVDAIPSVAGVVPKATPEGKALAEAVKSPTVAVAGTQAASTLATKPV